VDPRLVQLIAEGEMAWAEMGDPKGYPVFAFHGTPGSRHHVLVEPAAALAAGARVIAPDRPGYGASTWKRRRTLEGWANDVGHQRIFAHHGGAQPLKS
jgi:pimeloyl-ACP methyl ester carboxylesterase